MTDKQIIIDGKTIGCPCYIDRPLYRYDKACLVQSQSFTEQQTEEKPILRCDEIKNCLIKENYKQLKRKEQECEELKDKIKYMEEYIKTVENARDELERENKFLKEENTEIRKYQYEQDFLQQQLDQLKTENEELDKEVKLLRQYKCSKQASYESMQVERNKAVSRNQDLLKQVEKWQEKCNKLETENEKLKHDNGYEVGALEETIDNLKAENDKLEQTLSEIKEIMKKHCRKCKKHKSYYFKLCCTCKYADILQKISEVIK